MDNQVGFAPRREMRTCHNYWCNHQTREPVSECPKCGRQMLGDDAFRGMGWLLMVPGALLAAAGGALLVIAAPKLVGGIGVKLLVYGIFSLLTLAGLTFMAAGLRQALTGSRSQQLIGLGLVLVTTIAIVVAIARFFF